MLPPPYALDIEMHRQPCAGLRRRSWWLSTADFHRSRNRL